ncbi:MAG: tRNA (adenosine(37)-N6)-threonylcarbamoyltransferase complex dimerization subunit type 1 TsaB [Planctomycetia bacterium]|nr:tRNA (adenosine(37)-N6)-threonylcarbamoyltransferase complex dimerization subunit type 1 TsaB [Planctomycetia bacterium]
MRTIAIETTSLGGSLAALEHAHLLEEVLLDPAARTARTLAPALRDLLRRHGWRPQDIELIAVAKGPGSFTGLRIGVTAAKTLAYATGTAVLGVNSLEAIAARAPADCRRLEVAMEALRKQVFAASFERDAAGHYVWRSSTQLVDDELWLARLSPRTLDGAAVSGPVPRRLLDRLPPHVVLVADDLRTPTAAAVGALGGRLFAAGHRDDVYQLVPEYFRASAAEEKRAGTPARDAG